LDIDTILGTVNAADLFVAADVADEFNVISSESSSGASPFFVAINTAGNPTGNPVVELLLGNLVGYTGGSLLAGAFVNSSGTQTAFSSGILTPVLTPEPATGAIVGLALAGLIGFASRRKLARFRA
jgi:hypothetical protein